MRRTVTRFTFAGSQGVPLDARLDVPPGPMRALVLFAHCFTCGKDIAAASRISSGLVGEGFGVLRFDFTGLGSSDGEFANTNFTSNIDDLVAAADVLRERHEAPRVLVGHSLGGAAVLAAASRIPEVEAVVTIAAPSDPAHVSGVLPPDALAAIEEVGEAEVDLGGRPFRIRKQFLDDISDQKLSDAVAHLGASLLILHSPIDQLVSVDHARRIYEAARHPKSFVSLDGADHLLSDRADAAYVAGLIAAWVDRYVPAREVEPTEEGHVVVEEAGSGDFTQVVRAGRHTFLADEPIGIGDDTGPNPYDLLLAGLGACTSMTMRMYATRKELPLDGVTVTLTHDRRHGDDCSESGRCAHIERRIEIDGDLTDEQRSKLLEIADKCPVHRTLEGEVQVVTTLAR